MTGYVTNIREKNCVVPPPHEQGGSNLSLPSSTTPGGFLGFGASAAVVGEDMATKAVEAFGVSSSTVPVGTPEPVTSSDLEKELAELSALERELAVEDVLDEDESSELAALEAEILELELEEYLTEEQQLEKAIQESIQEQHERDHEETTVKRSLSPALADAAEPPVKKVAVGTDFETPRSVATPQKHADDAKLMPPPFSLPPIKAPVVSTWIEFMIYFKIFQFFIYRLIPNS